MTGGGCKNVDDWGGAKKVYDGGVGCKMRDRFQLLGFSENDRLHL